jgi:hypothetical protein
VARRGVRATRVRAVHGMRLTREGWAERDGGTGGRAETFCCLTSAELDAAYHMDLPIAEIATRTGADIGTVKSGLHYAEQRLRLGPAREGAPQ